MNRTKIVATIGPAVDSEEMIIRLVQAGMNGARLNFSHGSEEEHTRRIQLLQKVRKDLKVPLAIILDTKGPEVRLTGVPEQGITVEKGGSIWIGKGGSISLHPEQVIDDVPAGSNILMDDGYVIGPVCGKRSGAIEVSFPTGAQIRPSKRMTFPGVDLSISPITSQDEQDILFGCKLGIDALAASFVRSKETVLKLRQMLKNAGRPEVQIYSKIEDRFGVERLEEILQVSDGVMVARGDLGVELPLPQVPVLQKNIIRSCHQMGKAVLTATQMLESMIQHPRPTRAEVSDVANAVYDSSSSLMLSGETAAGEYPVEAVSVMSQVIAEAEKDFDYELFFESMEWVETEDISEAVSLASVKTAYSAGACAIFVITSSGRTARLVSRLRPKIPIVAFTNLESTYQLLALEWGVTVMPPTPMQNIEDACKRITQFALERRIVQKGDLVVITSGTPFGVQGSTNMMMVRRVQG